MPDLLPCPDQAWHCNAKYPGCIAYSFGDHTNGYYFLIVRDYAKSGFSDIVQCPHGQRAHRTRRDAWRDMDWHDEFDGQD